MHAYIDCNSYEQYDMIQNLVEKMSYIWNEDRKMYTAPDAVFTDFEKLLGATSNFRMDEPEVKPYLSDDGSTYIRFFYAYGEWLAADVPVCYSRPPVDFGLEKLTNVYEYLASTCWQLITAGKLQEARAYKLAKNFVIEHKENNWTPDERQLFFAKY